MKAIGVSAAVLFWLLGTAALGQQPQPGGTVAVIGSDGVQRVEISGSSYYFDPSVIVLKVNVPAEITVKKAGGHKPHKIRARSPEAGIDFSAKLGKAPRTIRFTPTKAGEYPFWCPVHVPFMKSHKAHGMTGTIRVVE